MKLSVNEAKLTNLWARNCATIQQVWILKFAFGPKKFAGLFKKQVPDLAPVDRKIQNGNHRKQIPSIDKVINLHLNIINCCLICEFPVAKSRKD